MDGIREGMNVLRITLSGGNVIDIPLSPEEVRTLAQVEPEWRDALMAAWNDGQVLPGFAEHFVSCDRCRGAFDLLRQKTQKTIDNLVAQITRPVPGSGLPA